MDKTLQERYNRHIILDEIGIEGQEKLKKSSVMVVGAGGLGSPVLQYLVAAGIGHIGIIDSDVVSLSNLQRQILYNEQEIGKKKAEIAANKMKALNSECDIKVFDVMLDGNNIDSLLGGYDIIVGATDNFASRITIDKFCKKHTIPFVNGSIEEFKGQISVFNYQDGPSYTELFGEEFTENDKPIGVVGALPGIIGSMQALEVIKIVLGKGEILSGKLFLYDGLQNSFNIIDLS